MYFKTADIDSTRFRLATRWAARDNRFSPSRAPNPSKAQSEHGEKRPADVANRPEDETGESPRQSPRRTPARLASGQAPSKRRHRPGVNRSQPADPRREGNASPAAGLRRATRRLNGCAARRPGANGKAATCEHGVGFPNLSGEGQGRMCRTQPINAIPSL